jgi:hypothetical protein
VFWQWTIRVPEQLLPPAGVLVLDGGQFLEELASFSRRFDAR